MRCWPGFYMDFGTFTCVRCQFPCASCMNNQASSCSSCVQGYVFSSINNTCT
jgi:hypothetical protein